MTNWRFTSCRQRRLHLCSSGAGFRAGVEGGENSRERYEVALKLGVTEKKSTSCAMP